MRRRKKSSAGTSIVIMAIVTAAAITLAGVFLVLYIAAVRTVKEIKEENNQLQGEVAVTAFSSGVNAVDSGALGESKAVLSNEPGGGNIDELLSEKELEVEDSLKQKMKELVTSDDGSPLKMLRAFFPENLIYYDEEEYVFAPVDDSLKMHDILQENLVKNDRGEMEYVKDGVVASYKGMDVSKYQGSIDWEQAKADGIEYAFIRLGIRGYSTGKLALDEYFEDNMSGAAAAGIETGVYFFTQAVNVAEAAEEAQFVLESIAGYDVRCPIVFDVELLPNADARANGLSMEERTDAAVAFCETIKEAGYVPMIYGNIKCFTKLLDMSKIEDYEKWYAFYDDYMYFPYELSCWQYTENGKVAGVKGNVDLNISYRKLWE